MSIELPPLLLQGIENEVQFVAVRSRGPGGQNVNKVSSAAILYWNYLESTLLTQDQKYFIQHKLVKYLNSDRQLYLRSDEYRDLPQNKARCIAKLLGLLITAFHKEKPRKASRPTKASKLRKRESKSRRGEIKKSRKKVAGMC